MGGAGDQRELIELSAMDCVFGLCGKLCELGSLLGGQQRANNSAVNIDVGGHKKIDWHRSIHIL